MTAQQPTGPEALDKTDKPTPAVPHDDPPHPDDKGKGHWWNTDHEVGAIVAATAGALVATAIIDLIAHLLAH